MSTATRLSHYGFVFIVGWVFLRGDAKAASPPVPNAGVFVERTLPDTCYAIRRLERSGFEKYYTGELVTDSAEKPGAPDVVYPFVDSAMTPRDAAYADIVTNHVVDIMCVGNEITISTPLYSNGGDVFIFANHLDVRAPIDTRIYFDIGNRTRYFRKASKIDPERESFFASYYKNNPEGKSIGSTTYAPEMPSGSLINYSAADVSFNAEDGSPPPTIPESDRILARSGSITVFAKSIDAAEPLRNGSPVGSELCEKTPLKPFAFQAGGLRGGKGGIGSPAAFTPGGWKVAEGLYVNSGYNAPPGRGSDASNVFFYRLAGKFTLEQSDRLRKATNVAGGLSGPSAKYKTIDGRELESGVSTDICDRTPAGRYPAQSAGEPGTIWFGSAGILQALERAESFAAGADSRPSVDVKDILARARSEPTIVHRNFREFLRSRLSRIALSAQKGWAETLSAQVAGQVVRAAALPTVEPFTGIGQELARMRVSVVSSNVSGLAIRLGRLDIAPSVNPTASYFTNAGGAFTVVNPDATSAINGKVVGEDLAQLIGLSANELESLNLIEQTLNESLYTSRQAILLQQITQVQQKIAEIEAIPQNTGASFSEIAAVIKKNGPAIAKFAGAVVSENYAVAAQLFPAAMAGINEIYDTAYAATAIGPRPALEQLRSALTSLRKAIYDLNETYIEEKRVVIETQFNHAARELEARQRITSRIDGRLSIGDDLIKHSFIAYFLDPAPKRREDLVQNLQESAKFLGGATNYYTLLALPPLANECQLDPEGFKNHLACIKFPASSSYTIAETTVAGFYFPAWLVAPNPRRLVLPTYNAPMTIMKRKTDVEATRAAVEAKR